MLLIVLQYSHPYLLSNFTAMTNTGKDPLHGITLEMMLHYLLAHYSWSQLAERIPVNCFMKDPSVRSSLKFLRKTPWARQKVEWLYLHITRDGVIEDLFTPRH